MNPIAGMGGSVGLKGTDGSDALRLARERGATPSAAARAVEALRALRRISHLVEVFAYAGPMGAAQASSADLRPRIVGQLGAEETTSEDTRQAAREMMAVPVDLIIFAGGDGTARDIAGVVQDRVPVVGVPAGVKIHSGVFGVTPRAAGDTAVHFLMGESAGTREAEVMDVDEDAFRAGEVSARLCGFLRVPIESRLLQVPKVASGNDEAATWSIARAVVSRMDEETSFIIGPGTTTRVIMELLGLRHTLLGVDVVRARRIVQLDAAESALLDVARDGPAKIIVTPVGGQGHIFGRGNQPISARVIEIVGSSNIIVVATPWKLSSLRGRPLHVDTGRERVDRTLRGYVSVVTGERERAIYRVE